MGKQTRIALKALAIGILLVILYIFLPAISGVVDNPPGTLYGTVPAHVDFEFEQFINISARTFTLNITIPQNTQYQQVTVTDEASYPKTVHNEYNRTWWSYSLAGSAHLKILYSGETTATYWHIVSSGGVNDIPQWLKTKYDHPEYLQSYNGTKRYVINPAPFKNITENITASKSDVVGKLRLIYDEIVQNFQYRTDRNPNPQTAVETWNSKAGDCDELSFLFASMARSIGIPAWVEYGYLYTGSTWGQHAWIQTVVPVDGTLKYVNIDLTVEVGQKDLGRGFLVRDPYRITEWVDDGNSNHLSAYYQFLTYTEPPQLTLSQDIKVLKMKEIGTINIPLGSTIPSWLMALIFIVIVVAAIIIIVKF